MTIFSSSGVTQGCIKVVGYVLVRSEVYDVCRDWVQRADCGMGREVWMLLPQ